MKPHTRSASSGDALVAALVIALTLPRLAVAFHPHAAQSAEDARPAAGPGYPSDAPIAVTESPYAEYPTIASSGQRAVVAWMEHEAGRDTIRTRELRDGALGTVTNLTADAAGAAWPALTADEKGGFWIAYAANRASRWQIEARSLDAAGGLIAAPALDPAASCWRPAIAAAEGVIYLAWEETSGNASHIVWCSLRDGRCSPPQRASAGGLAFRPSLAARAGTCWLAWDEVVNGLQHEVYMRRLAGDTQAEPVRVTSHPALDASPSVALDGSGRVWVAWHSDRTPQGQWDIPRWSYVRCFDGTQWLAPAADVPGRQEDPRDENQGLEFPTITFDAAGGLWLFGRTGQGFISAHHDGATWDNVMPIEQPGWGGRGQHVRSALVGSRLWTIRRDVPTIVLQGIDTSAASAKQMALTKVEEAAAPNRPAPPPGGYPEPRVPAKAGDYQILFGDTHMHSSLSDGTGAQDEIYLRAREAYKFDFAALTDHDDFVGNRILPAEWDHMKATTGLFHKSPDFITLCAFEWTDARFPEGDGHKNVFYRGDGPMLWHTSEETGDGASLFERLRPLQGICFPHHIGWTGIDWTTHDPAVQANVELVSVHGAYEHMGNLPIKHRGGMKGRFVRDGLNLGKKFGLVGGSDAHGLCWHHGVGRRRNPWTQGLTGVLVKERTREAVWDALAARRCYATSGPKIILDFRVNDAVMGSEISANAPPLVTVRVVAPSPLEYITLIRDGEEVLQNGGDVNSARIRFLDDEVSTEAGRMSYYYVRVVLQDGEAAWSSPIWVNFEATASKAAPP